MLRIYFYAVLLFVSLTVCGWSANETEITVSATTPSVALFKNGVTVIHQEIEIPALGVYCWDKVPKVIHGTFFIESNLNVEIQTSQRLITLPVDEKNPLREIADFEGTEVTVRFCDPKISPIRGKLYSNAAPQESNSLFPASSVSPPNRYTPLATSLKLKTDDGQYLYLTGQQILSIETSANERTEYRPVMIFHVSAKESKTAGKIRFFYLTKGTTWAPSYRVNLLDDKRLQIEQSALIRNELMPLHDTEISLVSGFPQIESSQILSPLHPSQTLLQFFQQIQSQHINRNNRYGNNDVSFMSNALTQQAVHPYSVANTGFDTTTLTAGEGPDIHYNNIHWIPVIRCRFRREKVKPIIIVFWNVIWFRLFKIITITFGITGKTNRQPTVLHRKYLMY
jgi:hypothetical protein